MPEIQHHTEDLIRIFNGCFLTTENTELVQGNGEPIYLPADTEHFHHRLIFAHGFFASVLHEFAHWSIAGKQRRLLVDYGYWYEPDGRNADTQVQFAAVEARPQAIEWILSKSCKKPFYVSLDNLDCDLSDFGDFKQAIVNQVQVIRQQGLPPRAAVFQKALADFYGLNISWQLLAFDLHELN